MTDYERIEKLILHLETQRQSQPSLESLAKVAGLSRFQFHRLFSRWAGITPKAFLKALTVEHAKRLLAESKDLLNVSLEAGLSGPGRLHDLLVSVEGVSPGEFKARGAGLEIHYGFEDTSFGLCLIAASARGVCHLAFLPESGRKAALKDLRKRWPRASLKHDSGAAARLASSVFRARRGKRLTVLAVGTPFQLKVWKALLRIPSGRVLSYGGLAGGLGQAKAARAVGAAVGRNPVAFLIPCHRVIRETGVLGDYHWGSARKKAILAWESRPGRQR